uniref:Vesicle-associated membrane protein 5 n=1 Tax=Ursus maritimus TaxID=29073 RepID=A0A384CTW7_URSMA
MAGYWRAHSFPWGKIKGNVYHKSSPEVIRLWHSPGSLLTPTQGHILEAGTELERCQRQADEVTEIMLDNFGKVLERDGKLTELEQRSDQLLDMSSAFSKTTKTLAQKKRWENMRCRIYLGLVVGAVLLILLIVLLAIFLPQSSGGSSAPQAEGAASGSRN